jgi:NitT/TauT family transport system ATP-binding protein
VRAFEQVDLDVARGEFVSILGPSGCGKTTLLRVLARLEDHSSGVLQIAVPDPGRPVSATVFQQESVFPWLTVQANIAYGLQGRRPPREVARRVAELLQMVGLEGFAKAYPHQLSGGMKQRTAVARALAVDPAILFMDEPFGALDEQTRVALQRDLLRLWDETRKTVVFVTHSLDEALVLSDRILVMSSSPGRIVQEVTVPFDRPRDHLEVKADHRYGPLVRHLHDLLGREEAPA